MSKVRFTVAQLADAIEKNGLPQFEGWFFDYDGSSIVGACALGQAAINLNVKTAMVADPSDSLYAQINSLLASITDWNDDEHLNFGAIANRIRNRYPNLLNHYITSEDTIYLGVKHV